MKINKDLVDAVMMLSFIVLVLVGTTDFASMIAKDLLMGGLAIVTVLMVIFRIIYMRKEAHKEQDSAY